MCCVVCCIWISAVVISGMFDTHKRENFLSVAVNRHIYMFYEFMLCCHDHLVAT